MIYLPSFILPWEYIHRSALARYVDMRHDFEELNLELRILEDIGQLNDKQRPYFLEAKLQLRRAQFVHSRVEVWSCINLTRALRAYYLPTNAFIALLRQEQKRDKDFLDVHTRDLWQATLDDLSIQAQSCSSDQQIEFAEQTRDLLFQYLEQAGRKWNSQNASLDARLTSLARLSLLCLLTVILVVGSLNSQETRIGALFGAVGGLISSMILVRDMPLPFRSIRVLVYSFFVRPITGSIIALVLLQFLFSGISPIQITESISTNRIPWIAAVAFAAGLSERFVLGKLYFK